MPNTAAHPSSPSDLKAKVIESINLIRPSIQADGGDVELVDIAEDGTVKIRFHGACIGCPSANMTLYHGIRKVLVERVPQVKQVIAVR